MGQRAVQYKVVVRGQGQAGRPAACPDPPTLLCSDINLLTASAVTPSHYLLCLYVCLSVCLSFCLPFLTSSAPLPPSLALSSELLRLVPLT